jgi:hypothetical protein
MNRHTFVRDSSNKIGLEKIGLRVEVTEKDLRKGERFSCSKCPIGLAIRRVLPRARQIEVDPADKGVTVLCAGVEYFSVLPETVAEFALNFDEWGPDPANEDVNMEGEPRARPFGFWLGFEVL